MEHQIEQLIKFSLFFIVVIALLLFWLIPKTNFARRFKMSTKIFILTQIVGVLCGMTGLIVTFVWPHLIVEMHLWELIVLPFALMYAFWGLIIRIRKNAEIIDEKQDFDMSIAGALTMALTIPAMVVMFILDSHNMVQELLWFP